MPIISVILPTFNRASVIMRSITSVLNQSFRDLELIVVDDCSTDGTKEILGAVKDHRLRVVYLDKNGGACRARNVGIEKAVGDYIAFQDSGDEWLCEKLEKQMDLLKRSAYHATCSSYVLLGDNTVKLIPKAPRSDFSIQAFDLLSGNLVGTPTLLVKSSIIKKIGGFDESLPRLQDWDLAIRISQKTSIFFTTAPMTIAFSSDDSISKNREALVSALEVLMKKHHDLFMKNRKAMAANYSVLAINYFLINDEEMAIKSAIKSLRQKPCFFRVFLLIIFFILPISNLSKIRIYERLYNYVVRVI